MGLGRQERRVGVVWLIGAMGDMNRLMGGTNGPGAEWQEQLGARGDRTIKYCIMYYLYVLIYNLILGLASYFLSRALIAEFIPIFLRRNRFGSDLCKATKEKIAEPMGVITATVYLIILFIFLPAPFYNWMSGDDPVFPYAKFVEFLSGLLSICCMILLGFVDDILDLRWRHKLFLPTLGSLPLLMVYYINHNSTTIVLPKIVTHVLGLNPTLNIGFLYYIYIGMVAVYCTNAINILAGINGLEAGQSVVISCSIIVFNIVQLIRLDTQAWYHLFSLYFLIPYTSVTLALLKYNWFPAQVFVGDTFCYFSGMIFAVVGILGHFSKTLLLFFIPQIINFVYSLPQLFHVIPCPRHRLPKFNHESKLLQMSTFETKETSLKPSALVCVKALELLKILYVRRFVKDDEKYLEMNNFTVINFALKVFGPMTEDRLTRVLLIFQVCITSSVRRTVILRTAIWSGIKSFRTSNSGEVTKFMI
uniref:UDP-N-acetylglucosamine--dolichyl-phosphate N-acetylglucosaminephosphotransferase n=1 Tax=Romanomermis culicivorax TaxID=13658 RepID=A0A915L2D6_ROMCU